MVAGSNPAVPTKYDPVMDRGMAVDFMPSLTGWQAEQAAAVARIERALAMPTHSNRPFGCGCPVCEHLYGGSVSSAGPTSSASVREQPR